MSNQVTFSVRQALKKLQKEMESMTTEMETAITSAIKDAAYATYASIVSQAQSKLTSTRQDYLKGLTITELDENSCLIELDGKLANQLEDGAPGYNMTAALLKSQKTVEVGQRSGLPWVQKTSPKGKNKEQHKFAHVPLQRNPHSKAPAAADMAEAVRQMTAVNKVGTMQKLTKVFTDDKGAAIEGKVAVGKSDNPYYDGLVKYQKTYSKDGKDRVQSIYINYRTISEKGKPWMHPGFEGIKAFKDAERDLEKNLDAILKSIIEG